MIAIIDYGLGNIRSLQNWLDRGNLTYKLTANPETIKEASLLILPGVGAFEDAMEKIKPLEATISEVVKKGKPIVGICLGMQLLYDKSYEGGCFDGLGFISGKVVPFTGVKSPHMGWNDLISKDNRWQERDVYFVHSYYIESNFDEVVAYCEYDVKVPGIVRKDNVLGFQFHPEKSGQIGQDMLALIKELEDDYLSSN